MKIEYLKKWIKQNRLIEFAGRHFIDDNSDVVQNLRNQGEKALLGIKQNNNIYTILGENAVFYSTATGGRGKISLDDFSNVLQDYGLKKGKIFSSFKYLKINKEESIWLKNKRTMSALWNTVIWLEREAKLSDN